MSGLASVFPPPPPYFKKYTQSAWPSAKTLLEKGQELPFDLAELAPPAAPTADQKSYRNFGQIWNVEDHLPSLAESGIEQIYQEGCGESTATLVPELKKLLRSVLVGYLGLVQALSSDPTQFVTRVENLRTLFINMHHLLNTYRPLQSKESLMLMMEDQIRAARTNAEQMRQSNHEIGERIAKLAARIPSLDTGDDSEANLYPEWEGYDLDVDMRIFKDETGVEGVIQD